MATTGRVNARADGRTRLSRGVGVPKTLLLVGATSARRLMGAAVASCGFTATTARATGSEFAKVFRDTAVTPPRTDRFTYVTLVVLLLLLL